MKMWPSSSHSHVIPFTIVLEKFAWSAQSFHPRGRRGLALCASKRWSFELAALRQATTKNLKSLPRFRQLASNFRFNLPGRSKKTQVGVKPFLIPIRLRLPVLGQENYVRCAVCAESSQLSSQSCCFSWFFFHFVSYFTCPMTLIRLFLSIITLLVAPFHLLGSPPRLVVSIQKLCFLALYSSPPPFYIFFSSLQSFCSLRSSREILKFCSNQKFQHCDCVWLHVARYEIAADETAVRVALLRAAS